MVNAKARIRAALSRRIISSALSPSLAEIEGDLLSIRHIVTGYRDELVAVLSLSEDATCGFDAVQKERLVLATLLSLAVIMLTTIFNVIFPSSTNTFPVIDVMCCFALIWVAIRAMRTERVQLFCHCWIAVAAGCLWIDSIFTGGVTGFSAPLLVMLPVGAGLLLRIKNILRVGIANALAIMMIAIAEASNAPAEAHQEIMANAALLIAASTAICGTVITLVGHYQRVDRAREKLLLSKDYVASHDGLTGLLNRTTIAERIARLDPATERYNLFLLDLDGFKDINDNYGHDAGDKLLIRVAKRLRQVAPNGAQVARLGGDEFLVLVEADQNGTSKNWNSTKCPGEALVEALSKTFPIDGLELQVSGSIGVAHFPADANNGDTLLKRADLALYAAKAMGRNKCIAYKPYMEAEQHKQIMLQNHLRQALDRGDIFAHYQPQYCLKSGNLIGFEALSRWKDAVLGIVSPEKFVAIAEDCGLIGELGEQVLRRACLEALEWPALSGEAPLRLSVNVSALQLKRANFVSSIKAILAETGFPPERLELEITESVLIADPEKAMITLNQLAAMGIAIAMDDFGKGYSSLSYLQSFSLARLKIDRSFITNLNQPNGAPIINAIITLAKAMNLTVVAEGVETEGQRQALRDLGCDYAQGYLYAPGLSGKDTLKHIITAATRQARAKAAASPPQPDIEVTLKTRTVG